MAQLSEDRGALSVEHWARSTRHRHWCYPYPSSLGQGILPQQGWLCL